MAKTCMKKMTSKGAAIKFQIERGMSNVLFQNHFESQNQLSYIIGKDLIF